MSHRRRDIVSLHSDRDMTDEDSGHAGATSAERGALPAPRQPTSGMQLEVALYIESMSAELRLMARGVELESLAYFLEMVRIEASIQIQQRAEPS